MADHAIELIVCIAILMFYFLAVASTLAWCVILPTIGLLWCVGAI